MSEEHRPKPRRRRLLWLLPLPALAAALYATRPRPNQLVPYTTGRGRAMSGRAAPGAEATGY